MNRIHDIYALEKHKRKYYIQTKLKIPILNNAYMITNKRLINSLSECRLIHVEKKFQFILKSDRAQQIAVCCRRLNQAELLKKIEKTICHAPLLVQQIYPRRTSRLNQCWIITLSVLSDTEQYYYQLILSLNSFQVCNSLR